MEQATTILNLAVMAIFFVVSILALIMMIKTYRRDVAMEREVKAIQESGKRFVEALREREVELASAKVEAPSETPRRKVGRPRKNK